MVLGQESLSLVLPEYHVLIRTRALGVCPLLSHSSLSKFHCKYSPIASRATVRGYYDAHGGPTNAKLQELLSRAVHTHWQYDSWATYGWGRQGFQSISLDSDPPWWLRRPNRARSVERSGREDAQVGWRAFALLPCVSASVGVASGRVRLSLVVLQVIVHALGSFWSPENRFSEPWCAYARRKRFYYE